MSYKSSPLVGYEVKRNQNAGQALSLALQIMCSGHGIH